MTYTYLCPACGREFEIEQRITDPPGGKCPDCSVDGRRLISGTPAFYEVFRKNHSGHRIRGKA